MRRSTALCSARRRTRPTSRIGTSLGHLYTTGVSNLQDLKDLAADDGTPLIDIMGLLPGPVVWFKKTYDLHEAKTVLLKVTDGTTTEKLGNGASGSDYREYRASRAVSIPYSLGSLEILHRNEALTTALEKDSLAATSTRCDVHYFDLFRELTDRI